MAGTQDNLATVEDTRWAFEKLKQSIVHYEEYDLGHLSFFIAKDMSYFSKDVVGILEKYHLMPS